MIARDQPLAGGILLKLSGVMLRKDLGALKP